VRSVTFLTYLGTSMLVLVFVLGFAGTPSRVLCTVLLRPGRIRPPAVTNLTYLPEKCATAWTGPGTRVLGYLLGTRCGFSRYPDQSTWVPDLRTWVPGYPGAFRCKPVLYCGPRPGKIPYSVKLETKRFRVRLKFQLVKWNLREESNTCSFKKTRNLVS
jgi:hypothetical protein